MVNIFLTYCFTGRLMLLLRALPHSTRPTSNNVSRPYNNPHSLDFAAMASCRFRDVHMCVLPAAEKRWLLACITSRTNITCYCRVASTVRHCIRTEQQDSGINSKEDALITNAQCRHMEYANNMPSL